MKIIKYKRLANGKYKIIFDNNELVVYEEVILKYNLLLKKEISNEELININQDNIEWEAYYTGLKSLKSRFKSKSELRKLLISKEYNFELVDKVVNKLEKQGYLDDINFSKSYVNNQIITTNKGPNKIVSELRSKGVKEEDICLDSYLDDLQIERINKLINKAIKSNRTRGGVVLKKKIVSDLINLGYDSNLVNDIVDSYSFPVDKTIYKKEYDKLYKVLSRKYKDKELENKIKQKLYQKGLYYED